MKSPRRSIYLKVMRNKPDSLLEAFDTADSFGSVCTRNVTTTPTQALLMINGDWPLKRAEALATRVRHEAASADNVSLVQSAYRLAYGRLPHADEQTQAVDFLNRSGAAESKGLVDLCHVLLNSNEFLYAD